jgi:hypothetical protein
MDFFISLESYLDGKSAVSPMTISARLRASNQEQDASDTRKTPYYHWSKPGPRLLTQSGEEAALRRRRRRSSTRRAAGRFVVRLRRRGRRRFGHCGCCSARPSCSGLLARGEKGHAD